LFELLISFDFLSAMLLVEEIFCFWDDRSSFFIEILKIAG